MQGYLVKHERNLFHSLAIEQRGYWTAPPRSINEYAALLMSTLHYVVRKLA